ncbi:serine hydrolase domain-containing protein [Parapedobacter tibetensis]|uniref:serine hydrolase domain-containing protein n=1 Tax=Parapedobacter tibetensis TaxID=2972951 RepID=UPI00215202EA|nr:serine hydrolase [Parapedobacter tibetensis]
MPRVNHTVLLNNQSRIVPLRALQDRRIAHIANIDEQTLSLFGELLDRYAPIDHFAIPTNTESYGKLDERLKFYNTLILAVNGKDLGNKRLLQFINTQAIGKQVILAVFGDGTKLGGLDFVRFPILWNPELTEEAASHAAMSVFGGIACTARLPQSFSTKYAAGAGFTTEQTRLAYTDAALLGIDAQHLGASIDTIVEEAIRERATPGAVVMVVKNGKVIFEKAYGYHTYDRLTPTEVSNIFDLASLTKIMATTPSVMRLTERGVIHLDSTMGYYLLQARNTNKNKTKLRDVMLHEAGFIPYIPFYRELKSDDLSPDSSAAYSVKVADGCYIRTGYYEEVMWSTMLQSKLNASGSYVYSDISMYVMKEVTEHQTGFPIQDYIQQEFYRPLGMKTAGYGPRERFGRNRIVPTENDKGFRKTLLQGYVHDQGAAMAGGIAGHAGLFATANDLAIYGQLLLNRGAYGGDRYFRAETVDLFTSRQSANSRRGLGFDRWDPDTSKHYPSKLASDATFGHTGYTGTCIWIDPKEQLVYIFLSNRVHPEVSTKLISLNIRGRIQDAVYEAIQAAQKN